MSNDDTPQPNWNEVSLDDRYTWTDATSSNGQTYKIGTLNPETTSTSTTDDASASAAAAAPVHHSVMSMSIMKAPFDIKVEWTASDSQAWAQFKHPSAEETKTTGITSYYLLTSNMYYNEFSFTCTEAYNYHFYDKTGDSYQCNVFWPRSTTTHTVAYFSSKPTIVRVTGK
ncbi:hypothetical protein TWF696_000642 [Orbilia brochopaga]|uniref:Uncharacterized protein n=1 Tax=Orbilia brochopaga TaxID=3140254 RepID=A0AAV9VEA5_9PEZI